MIHHESFLGYRRFRHLGWSAALLALAAIGYLVDRPEGGPGGDTLYGTFVGAISVALILWLMAFRVRKRHYTARGAPLRGWLSAHVYLGASLVLLVPLHAAFEFGRNVHTLAYVLLLAVVLTGFVGVALYVFLPRRMSLSRGDRTVDDLLERIEANQRASVAVARSMASPFAELVLLANEETAVPQGLRALRPVGAKRCGTGRALRRLEELPPPPSAQEREQSRKLFELLSLNRVLLARVRGAIRFQTWLQVWLLAHVPLSFACLVAVAIHVFAVFYNR